MTGAQMRAVRPYATASAALTDDRAGGGAGHADGKGSPPARPPAAASFYARAHPGPFPVDAPITVAATAPTASPPSVLDLVIPVYNEEADLEPCLRRVHAYLSESFPYPFQITVADNASTDHTLAVADGIASELPGVAVVHLDLKGRGHALKSAWAASPASVLAYMDVDLSTDLRGLLPLVAPLISGHSDLAIGTRLSRGSRVVRGLKREVLSRGYNLLLRGTLAARFSDAQSGFKAIRKDVAERLLPFVEDTGWFFDTELLVLAQRSGLRIHEVPVDWIDDPDSRVNLVGTAIADLRGIARLGRGLLVGTIPIGELRQMARGPLVAGDRTGLTWTLPRQLMSFAAIGVVSTVAYVMLYVLLGGAVSAQTANVVALLTTAVANTAANRRLTFGITGRRDAVKHQLQGLVALGLALALTGGSLATLHMLTAAPARAVELAVLVAGNLAATVLRFILARAWMFHRAGRR